MIRFICLNGFIAIHTIIFCIWSYIIALFDKEGRIIHHYVAAPWARIILWVCGIKVRTEGRENIDARRPRIYMTNHQSYFDIFALLAFLPVDFKFILKQELMKIPLLGFSMRRAGYIGIEREDPRKAVQSIIKAAERIKNGASVVIFPEGTRSIDGKLQPFKRGGFKLALRSGCDIVPVTISDSYRIVPKGSLKINKGSFGIHIGKPISAKGYDKRNVTQLMEVVRDAMLSQMHDGSNG
ncbi:MAG: 1-acyl-sn-glycerol-3-phosphate acyltransferase [Desulfobacteraceae bacterium]|nr:MAG: 1-acyl-sn-glycerol-3-phosphate acyltransferase [Desulfobacteraceae bacterium]